MLSVSTTTSPKFSFLIFLLLGSIYGSAQENSPFSRYGLGDVYSSQNIVNRAMGGTASTYGDGQSVNFINPASYSMIGLVTYDIGITVDSRILRSANPVQKYNSVNFTPSYVALGLPVDKKRKIGLAFGLRPLTKISYSIEERKRLPADSVLYSYEGNGGLYQAFVGFGKGWIKKNGGGLSIGFNTGYMFGSKENTTRTIPIDSVLTYKSNSTSSSSYNNVFINAGLQYAAILNDNTSLRFGFSGNLKQKLNARQTINRETFAYDANGGVVKIDSVFTTPETAGTIKLPVSYTVGISLNSNVVNSLGYKIEKSTISIEYQSTKWADYRFYNQADKLINSYQLRVGGSLTPNPLSIKSYWNTVTYRAGFYMGKDAVNADGNELSVYGVTLGAGFRIRKWRSSDNQYTNINTTFEYGKRGNNNNNISENFFRVSFGLNLSDVWFVKRRYD